MKAKECSMWTIIVAIVWVAVLSLAKAFAPVLTDGRQLGLTMTEIVASGMFFVVAWSPVYRSIWLDKKLGVYVSEQPVAPFSVKKDGGDA